MFIRPSQKRIEFERFLLDLGIKDRNPIIYPKLVKEQILENIYPHLKIYFSIKDYKNKKSYLYEYFKNNSKEKTKTLYKKLKVGNKNRVAEVIWSIDGNLKSLTLEDSKILLFEFIKEIKKRIPIGICGEIPYPNDILMCKPSGEGLVSENFMLYLNHRASLYKRLGFGEVDEDLCQYAIYDQNLNLKPI